MTGKLEREIKQKRPFSSVQEEVVLAMMRTADQLATPLLDVLRDAELSLSQYNVLRILRGADSGEGLACGDISERMVRRDPDLTRLLDRLESRGLVERARGTTDRRVVLARITPAGRHLVESLDDPIRKTMKKSLAHMTEERVRQLVELLEEARG
jgi:DNA-binding MarR family transcriptional regulator